jgi:microsomal dipeptidase-like Zn-dependent dipeptidase
MVNKLGITADGLAYVHELMKHGMLIDIEHMSDAARRTLMEDVANSPLWEHAKSGHCPAGNSYSVTPGTKPRCYYNVYPVLSSHTVFRAQSPLDSNERAFLPNEQQRTPEEVEFIRRTQGLVGPVVSQPPRVHIGSWHDYPGVRNPGNNPSAYYVPGVDSPVHSTIAQDCAGSSKSFAEAMLYADEKMRMQGISLATDTPFVGGTSPRFPIYPGNESAPNTITLRGGPYANNCRQWRHVAQDPDLSDAQKSAEIHDGQYNFDQSDSTRVRYAPDASVNVTENDGTSHDGLIREGPTDNISYGARGSVPWVWNAFDPSGIPAPARNGDFNVTGLDRYGKIPDLLQDARNVGMTPADMAPLFNSAEAYVQMWARAYRIVGCLTPSYGEREICVGTPPTSSGVSAGCFGTCPDDPGRGLWRAWKGTDPLIRHFDFCPNVGDAALPPDEPACDRLR